MRTLSICTMVMLLAGCPIEADVDVDADGKIENTTPEGEKPSITSRTPEVEPTEEDAGTDELPVVEDAGAPEEDASAELEPSLCEADATSCVNGNAATCNKDGSAWNVTEVCTEGCAQGHCLPCEAGETLCNGDDVLTCTAKGWKTNGSCEFGCFEGVCNLCETGETLCEGTTQKTCTGLVWEETECSYLCIEGGCADKICEPGAMVCSDDGNAVECNDNGTAWIAASTCTMGCTDGVCHTCSEDEMGCSGDTPRSCVDGFWHEVATSCEVACVQGACVECRPGARKCDDHDGGTFAQVCDETGHWVDDTQCTGASSFCTAGECGECNPGATPNQCVFSLCKAAENGNFLFYDAKTMEPHKSICRVCAEGDSNCNETSYDVGLGYSWNFFMRGGDDFEGDHRVCNAKGHFQVTSCYYGCSDETGCAAP